MTLPPFKKGDRGGFLVYLIALIGFLLPTYLVRFELMGIPSTGLEVLIWAAFVIGSIQMFQDRSIWNRLLERKIWLVPAKLIALGALIGLLIAPDLRVALGLYKGFILDPILVYVLALAFLKTWDDLRMVAWGLFAGAGFVAAWSLIDAGGITAGGRVIGPYAFDANASPNYLAFALAPLLPLAVWLGDRRGHLRGEWPVSSEVKEAVRDHQNLAKEGWSSRVLVLVIALVILGGIYASLSRAGFVAGIGGLIIAMALGWSNVKGQMSKVLVVGLLVLAALSWFAAKPDFSLSAAEGGRITASNNVRWQLWSATGELVQQHWLLGTGLGGFHQQFGELTQGRVNYPEFITPRARTPHNLLVGMWMETGLLGLIGMLMLLVLVGKSLFRAMRRKEDRTIAAALIGSWFVLLAHGLVDQPIWKNDTMVMFWLLVALSAVLTTGIESESLKTRESLNN